MSTARLEGLYSRLRGNMSVSPEGASYFKIRYEGRDPRKTFLIAQKLGQLFINETSERQREESRSAFDFIDKQVKSYEQQISSTEQKLKEFLSRNVEGTEDEANRRMAQIRNDIESAQLELEELQAKEQSLKGQINSLPRTVASESGDEALTQRIKSLEERLDRLQLRYEDSYPDVASLKRQIQELKERRERMQSGETEMETIGENAMMFNPVYQELKKDLSRAQSRQESLRTRVSALKRRLKEQQKRMQKIQANKAERSELTRNLQVNREIYNDLLKRRERARVSMRVDIDGQGMAYQIHEQARYPIKPSGLQFKMFASAGWILGLLAPFGLLGGLLQVDPRVRTTEQIGEELDIPLLGSIPPVRTPYERRRERRGYVLMVFVMLLVAGGYAGVAFLKITGVIG